MAVQSNISVFGIYREHSLVSEAVEALKAAGFRQTDISVLYPDNLGSKDFAHERHTKAPEGAVAGGGSGAVVGAAVGWLIGAGALMVPGMEAAAVAGPVMGMLSGMGAGVTLGGIAGALVGAGMPEYEAKRYEGRVRKGGILVSVHCDNADWSKTASTVLKRTGAHDISRSAEAKADFASSRRPLPRAGVPEGNR
ncbi:MAG TPA: quinol:electron acceptor oxidoreductase subunit ActD [Bryobacteraceae bacterium]|nr:quinol:electron acceptor oxidoreductase subunit ActD [Bryobacteraceae bacterium]